MDTIDSQGGDEFEMDVEEGLSARPPDRHIFYYNDVEVTDVVEIEVETTNLGNQQGVASIGVLHDHTYAARSAVSTARGKDYETNAKGCANLVRADGSFNDSNMAEYDFDETDSETEMEDCESMPSPHSSSFYDDDAGEVAKTIDLGNNHQGMISPSQLVDHSYAAKSTVSTVSETDSETEMEDCESMPSPHSSSFYDDDAGEVVNRGSESETDTEQFSPVSLPDGCIYDSYMSDVNIHAEKSGKYQKDYSALEHAQTSVKSYHPVGFSLATGTSDMMHDFHSDEEFADSENEEVDRWAQGEHELHRSLMMKGWHIKPMLGDGACMFRAVAHQLFGDQDLHSIVRQQCMDYIVASRSHYENFIVEEFEAYVARKRQSSTYGNHIELQAMSSLYDRTIEIYSGNAEPIIIAAHSGGQLRKPIRISYHYGRHYNCVIDGPHPALYRDFGSSDSMAEESGLHEEEDVKEKRRWREILAHISSIKVYIDHLKEDAKLIQQIISALEEKLGSRKRDASVRIATIRLAQSRYRNQLQENNFAQRNAIEEYTMYSDAVNRCLNGSEGGNELSRISSEPSPAFLASESYDSATGSVHNDGSEEDPDWCSSSSAFNDQFVDSENTPSSPESS